MQRQITFACGVAKDVTLGACFGSIIGGAGTSLGQSFLKKLFLMMDNMNSNDMVFLKPEIKLEPLVCRWYAWSHLISPAQLSLHLAFRLLPLLKSFVTNPAVHLAANSDPLMFGGPFADLSMDDLPQMQALMEETTLQCANMLTLANDLRALAATLQEKATGHSLNDLYAMLPDSLKGLVEFLYDTDNHASIRLFEDLLQDEYPMAQSCEIMLQPVGERDRLFFMSTPRARAAGSLSFPMQFSDPRLDVLAQMRFKAAPLGDIARLFAVAEPDLPTFNSFFTSTPPASKGGQEYAGDGVRMQFFGHACVLFQTRDVSVLFDPTYALEPHDDNRLTINDLPEFIDYVILTHHHHDHFNPEMLIQLRHRIGRVIVSANNSGSIADPSLKLALMDLGFTRIDVLSPFDSVALPDGNVLSLPFTGEHADLNIYSKHAIALTLKGRKFMFLIDSDGRDVALYQRIMRRIGPVDVLFIGMECNGAPLNWLYEPLLTKPLNRRNNESRRLSGANCERAWNILQQVKAPQVFVYAMGQDPWMKYLMGLEYTPDSIQLLESNKFLAQCEAAGVVAERLVIGREQLY
jgi:L-ascorbate metabolism protein UlaG (beta-lactamase superfamily)